MTEILAIFSTVSCGLNIFQFIFWKTQRDKMRAEADSSMTDAHRKDIDLQQDQYDYLLQKLNEYQEQYFTLSKKLQDEMMSHMSDINAKCDEIAALKSKLIYFKGLRCYRSDCGHRISKNPQKEENNG